MKRYLVERYAPRASADAVTTAGARVRAAAEQLTVEGTPVRYLRSIFIPDDETCFFLFDASSDRNVTEALTRAGITFERVVETAHDAIHTEEQP